MKMTVTRWIADQKNAEMKRYNYFADIEYMKDEQGAELYADMENDTVTYADVEIIKESEKAVQVAVSCGAVDGKIGTFKTWLPKSQIVSMA